ncbi:MAG: hypothetical protein JZU60_00165 [Ilumatobacteraceae bacterium]|jgi:hypothetical protein|nr:hypothetical protein [Ilumatobacteraceae bacterium]
MDESINLILGFLEYQIPNKTHRLNLAKKFKALSEKTLYLNYIYTDNLFRHQHLTSWFLKYIITEEKMLFSYIWLRREINSTLFDRCGFINFCWAVEEIIGRTDFKEYFEENKSPAFMLENHEYMVNLIRS